MKKLSAAILLCALVIGGYVLVTRMTHKSPAPHAPPPVPVVIAKVTLRDVPIILRGIGTMQADSTVTLRSRVDGLIIAAPFTEGQNVTEGELLFQIDPRPYQAALEQAQAAKARDTAMLDNARRDLDRYRKLNVAGFQTLQALEQQEAQVDQLQASIAGDQAAIDAAALNLNFSEIRSPVNGRTGARLVDAGNLIHTTADTPLVTITALHPIFVNFSLPQDHLDDIATHQRQAPLAVEVYSEDDKTQLAQGVLTLIDNQVDPTTGTIHLKAQFKNLDDRLWPGEAVSVHLVLDTLKQVTTVPSQAVLQGPDGAFVYTVEADHSVRHRTVRIMPSEDNVTMIRSGVSAGETIVLDGQYRLTDKSVIAAVPQSQTFN